MSDPVSQIEAELGYPTSLDEWGLPAEGPPMREDQTRPAFLLKDSVVRHASEATRERDEARRRIEELQAELRRLRDETS